MSLILLFLSLKGDTFRIKREDGGAPGIQPVQPFGPEAKAFISKLLLGWTILLETELSVRDEDGRILAFAYYENTMVSQFKYDSARWSQLKLVFCCFAMEL
ncbi:thermonuclease family protein [Paenibacillus piscarius]|uniref:thermonuclease family protein n=1 Tax=Paenibacillus piscarius TaxID=1089681 RepID=UPI003B75C4FC